MPEHGKELEIEEESFGEFVEKYLHLDTTNLAVSHILINIMKVKRSGHINRSMFYEIFRHLGYFCVLLQTYRCSNPA